MCSQRLIFVRHPQIGLTPEFVPPDPMPKVNGDLFLCLYGNFSQLLGDGRYIWGHANRLRGAVSEKLNGSISGIWGDLTGLTGNVSYIWGNVTQLSGFVTEVSGDVTGWAGNVSGGLHLPIINTEKTRGVDLVGSLQNLTGDASRLTGRVSTNLSGNVSGLFGDISGITGLIYKLTGDITQLVGDISGLTGDATGYSGDLNRTGTRFTESHGLCIGKLA